MNIRLFTDDNARENILKHIRGGSGLCGRPPYYTEVARGDSVRAPSQLGKVQKLLSPLFLARNASETLMPPQTYSQLTGGCYAQELIEELNKEDKK